MSTAVGLQTVAPPEMKSPRGEHIGKLSAAYEIYIGSAVKVNAIQSTSRKIVLVGSKACVSAELLQSLVGLDTFSERENVSDVTDDDIENWISYRSRCSNGNVAFHVKDSLNRVTYKEDRKDPERSTLNFFYRRNDPIAEKQSYLHSG